MGRPRFARRAAIFAFALLAAAPGWARRDGKGREIEPWTGDPLFTITSVWSGASFAAGESLPISWVAAPALVNEPWIEEWELFLSLDGGATYSSRLTPHLDIAKRSFSIRLPAVTTDAARLMFRMGDERRELELEMPWTFRIAAAAPPAADSRAWAVGRGEAAREGEPGVTSWVEGGRDGSAAREVRAGRTDAAMGSVRPGEDIPFLAAASVSRFPSLSLFEPLEHPESETPAARISLRPAGLSRSTLEPRRRTCRQNE